MPADLKNLTTFDPRNLYPSLFSEVEGFYDDNSHIAICDNDYGKESLAASLDPAVFLIHLFQAGCKLVIEPAGEKLSYEQLRSSLFPVIIDKSVFYKGYENREKLELNLRKAFEAVPLEDGINHQAELIFKKALRQENDNYVFEWLREFSLNTKDPSFAASVLRCLSRLVPGTERWRSEIVRSALATSDVEIRDAAVQAAESWGGSDIRKALLSHNETTPWLCEYINAVIQDLAE